MTLSIFVVPLGHNQQPKPSVMKTYKKPKKQAFNKSFVKELEKLFKTVDERVAKLAVERLLK